MKTKNLIQLFVLILLSSIISNAQQKEFQSLTGPYLGQKPPGNIPEIFAPGIVSLGYHEHHIAISPDGTEMFFSVASADKPKIQIMFTTIKDGFWTTPSIASFSDYGMNLHPFFSPDGKRLYFVSTRPLVKNGISSNKADIWFVDRQENGWAEPVNMGDSINTENNESSPTVMTDGTIFFESNRNPDKKDLDIYASYLKNGVYRKAEKLPPPVNTKYEEGGPFISPDGRYLLFNSNRPGAFGETDIYIAFKNKDGTWTDPVNPGERINSIFYDWSPTITTDGKFMIFSSYRNLEPIIPNNISYSGKMKNDFGLPKTGNGTFYWIDAGFIEDLEKSIMKK